MSLDPISVFSNITQLICFTGSPSAKFDIPSSAEVSPLSLNSSSALVSGNFSISEASAGEYNQFILACDSGVVYVNMEGTALFDCKTCKFSMNTSKIKEWYDKLWLRTAHVGVKTLVYSIYFTPYSLCMDTTYTQTVCGMKLQECCTKRHSSVISFCMQCIVSKLYYWWFLWQSLHITQH